VEFGIDLEQMARGVEQLSAKLANGDKNASDAVQKLGISVSDLLAEGPKDAFLDVAEAVGRVDDPMQRAGLATELFGGKLAKVLLPALSDLRKKLEEVPQSAIISDENVTLAHDFDVQIAHLTTTLKAYSIAALEYIRNKEHQGPTTASTLNTTGISSGAGADIVLLAESTRKAIDNATLLQNKLDALRTQSLEPLTASQKSNIVQLQKWGEGEKDIAKDVGASEIAVHLYIQQLKDAETATKAQEAAAKKAAAEQQKFLDSVQSTNFGKFVQDGLPMVGLIQDFSVANADAQESFQNLTGTVNEFHNGITIAGDEIYSVTIPAFSTLPNVVSQYGKAIEKATSDTHESSDVLSALDHVLSGIHGKFGEVAGVAVRAASEIAKMADKASEAGTAFTTGDWLKVAAIGISAVVSAFGKLFSNPEKEINPIREAFVQLNGGLGELNAKAAAAGVTLTQMLNAKNADQYTAAINALNDAFKFQDDAMKTLDDTVAKYGFTISELGPTFAAQKLSEQAGVLLQDYQVLTAAGVDHVAIINKMGPALQDYVTQALKSGQAIPEAMKPALQSMVDMGTLTDESGQAMTDLSKLTFSETLDKKFSSLIDTINKLTDAISRGLGTAISNIPDKTVHIGFAVDPVPDLGISGGESNNYAASGGYVGENGVQYLAGGGRVLGWKPRGSDTVPAMLTPGEGVVNKRGMASLGKSGLAAINRGGGWSDGGSVSVVNQFSIAADIDSPASRERFRKAVDDATMAALSRQKRFQVA
jgi:hypothetical protein